MSDTADDLNAAHTAEQWTAQDLRQVTRVLGLDEHAADWVVNAWKGHGLDVTLARAHYELETLNDGDFR
ncbi:hypothetical protein [Nocardia wallacei]|uniref:hypothetical protein n=1 Tax=Nocardia wallacei TaxID=480035 RepID=UPI002454A085|nr:hypothetical protein [Nocardia wallacei]